MFSQWKIVILFKKLGRLKFQSFRFTFYGILFLIIYSLSELLIEGHGFHWGTFGHASLELLKEIGIALFILGSITIALEFKDFTDFFLKKLTEIVIKDEYINTLSDTKKIELKKQLEEKLYFKDQPHDPNSFFYTMQNKVSPLLDQCYYDENSLKIDCYIDGEIIRKTIRRKVIIVNPKNCDITIDLPFKTIMKSINGYKDEDLHTLTEFKIDGINKIRDVRLLLTKAIENNGNFEIKFDYKVNIRNTCIVELKTETIVPKEDIHYHNRITHPCKNYSITYMIHNDSYFLNVYAFGLMYNKNLEKNYFDHGVEVKFTDWVLPGDGMIFALREKKD